MMAEMPVLLLRFVSADTWNESERIVRDHEDVLLSDLAEVGMGMFIDRSEAAGDGAADMLRAHRTLLRRCRQIGIDAAFAEVRDGQTVEPDDDRPPAHLVRAVMIARRAGDRRGEAVARFQLGGHLVDSDAAAASDELEQAGRLFAELDAPFEASTALLNAAITRNDAHGARASLDLFQAAQAQVDRAAGRPTPPGHDLRDVRIRVQAAWLDALIELEHDDPAGSIADEALRHCTEILALTADPGDPADEVAAYARYTAHYNRVRLLMIRERSVEALPSARAVLGDRRSTDDAEWRAIARQMHTAIGAAQLELNDREDAGRHFVAAVQLAVPDHDELTVDLGLLGLNRAFRHDQGALADLLADLPAQFAAAGDRAGTARLALAHTQARDMTPGAPDLDLSIVAGYRAAAEKFGDLGEVAREADARYGAGYRLSGASLLHEEHRSGALTELQDAERLFRAVANWHGTGLALMAQGELLNRRYPDIVREDARIAHLSAATVEAFQRARRPAEEASARLMQAVDTAMHSDDPDLFLERCSAAFEANERGRASRILPTDRTSHDGSVGRMITLLAARTSELLGNRPDDARTADLVWGLDQIAKSRTMSDDLAAPAQ